MKKKIILAANFAIFIWLAFLILSEGFRTSRMDCIPPTKTPEEIAARKMNERASEALGEDEAEFMQIAEKNWRNPAFEFRMRYARLFIEGKVCPRDYAKAVEILEYGSEKYLESVRVLMLANLYSLGGWGIEKNAEKSEAYCDAFFKMTECGGGSQLPDSNYYSILGCIYRGRDFCVGDEVLPQNRQLAWKMIERGLDSGVELDGNTLYWLDSIFKRENAMGKVIGVLKRQYENGNFEMAHEYAEMLYDGKYVERDEAEAFSIMERYFEKDPKSAYYAAWVVAMLKNGIGTGKDPDRAAKIFERYKKAAYRDALRYSEYSKESCLNAEWAASAALRLLKGSANGGKVRHPKDAQLADLFAKFADEMFEEFTVKSGCEKLIKYYEAAGDSEKVEELYARYSARSRMFAGKNERRLQMREKGDKE